MASLFMLADSSMIVKAKKIVDKIAFSGGFNPEDIENPSLQRHYLVLEALALDEKLDIDAEFVDQCQPDLEFMQQVLPTYNTLSFLYTVVTSPLSFLLSNFHYFVHPFWSVFTLKRKVHKFHGWHSFY